jgi:hypothetical protein
MKKRKGQPSNGCPSPCPIFVNRKTVENFSPNSPSLATNNHHRKKQRI